jgi:hypothetical protein
MEKHSFCFLFSFDCQDGVRWKSLGGTGKSLRDYASPRCEDIKLQESDLVLEATRYEIKPRIIKMVATNPFRGVETDNPYRHMRRFTTLCNAVQQEGVHNH